MKGHALKCTVSIKGSGATRPMLAGLALRIEVAYRLHLERDGNFPEISDCELRLGKLQNTLR
jgi:hypothetical protein